MKKIVLVLVGLAVGLLMVSAACGDGGGKEEPTATAPAPEATATEAGTAAETPPPGTVGDIVFDAASATITVDGDSSDWDGIEGATVPMEQIRLENLDPAQVQDMEIEFGPLDPIDVTLKVATDGSNIYLLMEVPDDYDFNPDDHALAASMAVMFRIDDPAPTHMGAEQEDLETSLGVVDIWHWELDCGPGEVVGGQGIPGGDDPACNLDDEYAPNPEDREDDGGGDIANPDAENSLAGVWEHTARAQGNGAAGTWIFEFSRPLQTGDSQDVQFQSGGAAFIALAYWDADESAEGWSDTGHVVSSYNDWIAVTLP